MQALRERGSTVPNNSWPRYSMGVSDQYHAPAALYPWERTPGTHWIGVRVGLRAGLGTEARGNVLFLCRGLIPGRPVCSQTLYWQLFQLHRYNRLTLNQATSTFELIPILLLLSRSRLCHYSVGGAWWHLCLFPIRYSLIISFLGDSLR
jgi:hypothetical protein